MISIIAVLKAKTGKVDELREALKALILPTRQEPGNTDYTLFQLRDEPEVFYMRESWRDRRRWKSIFPCPIFRPLSDRWTVCWQSL